MVSSPASSSRHSPTNRSTSKRPASNYPTQRSAVSTAFDDKKLLNNNPSVVSAGTVVDPNATAMDLISANPTYKSPAFIMQNSTSQTASTSSPASSSKAPTNVVSNTTSANSQVSLTQKTTNFQPTPPPPISILKPSSPSPSQVKISTPSNYSTPSTGPPSSLAEPSKLKPQMSRFRSLVEPVM